MIYSLDPQLNIYNNILVETFIKKSLLICKCDDKKRILKNYILAPYHDLMPGFCDLFSYILQLQFLDDCTNEMVGSMSQSELTIH